MEFITSFGALFAGATAFAGIIWKKARHLKKIGKEGFELYMALNLLCEYVAKANEGGWTPEEGAKTGELAVKVKDEFVDFREVAGKLF